MNLNKVYVVTMYRWGDRENHSYVLGVYSTEKKAKIAGEAERVERGGNKYYPECLEFDLNSSNGQVRVVVSLEYYPYFKK